MRPQSEKLKNKLLRTALSASLVGAFLLAGGSASFAEVQIADAGKPVAVGGTPVYAPKPIVVAANAVPAAAEAPAGAEVIEIKVPADPIAKAAFDVLDKACARCHQEGKLKRERPAKNFGNILDFEAMKNDPHYIQPGNPDASLIYKQMVKKEMPYDCFYESACDGPSAEDVAHVRDWITKLGENATAACDTRAHIKDEDIVGLIAQDLNAEQKYRIRNDRYITLTHLWNSCSGEKEMEVYRQGVVKLLNSLSQSSDVLKLQTIDEYKTIIKFNLDDIGWSPDDWEYLLSIYPYNGQPYIEQFKFIAAQTYTELPYIWGDWLAFVASRPPVYYDLLRMPHTFQDLQYQLGLNIEENIAKYLVKRAGFQVSGVSRNNRMIERHAISTGAFWTSYDFATSAGNQNLFEHPLGPFGHDAFHPAGGESVIQLPNGFNSYYLATGDGKRLDVGPSNIVQDPSARDYLVTNAISCFGCHDQGFRKAKDDIREHLTADLVFPKVVREAILETHPEHAEMDAILQEDTDRFRNANKRAGLDPDLKLNGVEVINALSKNYENDVNLINAAWMFGYTSDEFLHRLEAVGGSAYALKRRLEQGVIPRDRFEEAFHELLPLVTDYTFAVAHYTPHEHNVAYYKKDHSKDVAYVAPAKKEEYVEPAKKEEYVEPVKKEEYVEPAKKEEYVEPVQKEEYVAPVRKQVYVAPAYKEEAYVAPAQEYAEPGQAYVPPVKKEGYAGYTPPSPKLTRDFELTLYSDKSVYKRNEKAIFYVSAHEDCYLTLIDIDSHKKATVIFPNKFDRDNYLPAGKELVIGGPGYKFDFVLPDKGYETVTAICNASENYTDAIEYKLDQDTFTDLGNYEDHITRAIKVAGKKSAERQIAVKEKVASGDATLSKKASNPGASDILARTAIKFQVK